MPTPSGGELRYVRQAILSGEQLSANGKFTSFCREHLIDYLNVGVLELTGSGTAAIETSAALCDLAPGDRVVLPSFTHPSSANAFLLRGANLRFVDIRPDTLCIDEEQAEHELQQDARVVIPVHYAGYCCEMNRLLAAASRHDSIVLEDAAQSFGSRYKGRHLGTLGDFGIYSFHETKNIQSGSGGALVLKRKEKREQLQVILDKGTNRNAFEQGKVDAYTWQAWGSSPRLPELSAAYLRGQLENRLAIQERRESLYSVYYEHLRGLQLEGLLDLPSPIPGLQPNAHIFFILVRDREERDALKNHLESASIQAVTHYMPLHLSPVGRQLGYKPGDFPVTENVSGRILRLPLHGKLNPVDIEYICSTIQTFFRITRTTSFPKAYAY